MDSNHAIEVRNVKKRFKVYFDKGTSLKERVLFRNRSRHEERWVLNGISFDVEKGETIGLIGRNGCGKSTTLKMLTRIMYPTEGTIELKGRVSSLIELGAGFHPDMSGRENIFTNASIFGLGHKEIEQRLDDIIAFSELEEFIDNPVRTYSSGMYMRLAFAVAINVDADILLIDEILSVGDASFQEKCFERLRDIKRQGTTIVIVSHVLSQIQALCDRAIWIDGGRIRGMGNADDVTQDYLHDMEMKREQKIEADFQKMRGKQELETRKSGLPAFCTSAAVRKGNQKIRLADAYILDKDQKKAVFIRTGDPFEVVVSYRANEAGLPLNFVMSITREDGVYCYGTGSVDGNFSENAVRCGINGKTRICFSKNNLLQGRYLVDLGIQGEGDEVYDYIYSALELRVTEDAKVQVGIVDMPHRWTHCENDKPFC